MSYPKQAASIHVEQLGNELCIYNWQRKEVHSLNPTAVCVWQQCDGQTSLTQIAAVLQAELHVPDTEAQDLAWLTLAQLEKAHLLHEDVIKPAHRNILPRRAFLKLGIAAALLPVVHSIVAPTPVAAQSPLPPTPTERPTRTPVPPTEAPFATATPSSTSTPSGPTATSTNTPTPTSSGPTATPTNTPTVTITTTSTNTPTITITATPTNTPTPTFEG